MEFIQDAARLSAVCAELERSSWAAVDTEADSLHHYVEKLCLLQISISDKDFVIDPLAALKLEPLLQILNQKALIFHGADFDVRILRKNGPFLPREIFDTMIAAQLLGYPKQSLADLVQRHCEIVLPKEFQKADWSERPLSDEMLLYASNDTHFLKTLKDRMTEELKEAGRLDWHRQFCTRLLEHLLQDKPEEIDETPWQIRGSKNLKGRALNVLKELWQWREEEAKKRDRPPFKVLNAEPLLAICEWVGKTNASDVAEYERAPRQVRQEYRNLINELIARAKNGPILFWQLPAKKNSHKKKWTDEHEKNLEKLKAHRENLSKKLGVQPGLLGTNTNLERAAMGDWEGLLPWQKDLILEGLTL